MLESKRSADRDSAHWFASTRWGAQAYPVAWQGWLLALAYTVFILAMVGAADAVGRGPYIFAILAFILAVTVFYLRVIYRHLRPRQNTRG